MPLDASKYSLLYRIFLLLLTIQTTYRLLCDQLDRLHFALDTCACVTCCGHVWI